MFNKMNFKRVFFAMMLIVFAGEAWAATISVTTTDIAAISGDNKCSLLEAIQAANTDTAVDACLAGSGADVIELQQGATYTQNVVITEIPGETLEDFINRSALNWLIIESSITINGNDATLERTSSGKAELSGRFIYIRSGGNLTLNKLVVHNYSSSTAGNVAIFNETGELAIDSCTVEKSKGSGLALSSNTGIFNNGGKLTIRNSFIKDNDGIGVYNNTWTQDGQASVQGVALISNSVISNNSDTGISNNSDSTMNIKNSIIKTNGTSFIGTGIRNGGTLTVDSTTISDNTGLYAGGIYNTGTATLINSTISGSSSRRFGGGLSNGFSIQTPPILKIINSTITNNKTGIPDSNGTVYENANGGGVCNLVNPTTGKSGTVEIINSIIAGNSDLSTSTVHPDVSGPITGNHNNLIGDITGATGDIGTGSDIVNPNPLLNTLKDNGGFTQTYALLAGSPAIDKADNAVCAGAEVGNTDQRGKTRPYGSGCDIGAYEYRPNADVILEAVSNPSPVCTGDNFDVTFKISSSKFFIVTEGYLHFDPSVLQVNSIRKEFSLGSFYETYNNSKGNITFSASNGYAFTNIPKFFTVNFKVVSMNSGSTLLDFDPAKMHTYDMSYNELSQISEDVTIVISCPDTDADGISDIVEKGAPSSDGNGDGISDSLQHNVTSLPSADTGNYLTVEITSSGCAIRNVVSKTEKDAGNGNEDPDGTYPQGLIEFDIPCSSANIRVLYHGITVENSGGADMITVNGSKIPLTSLKYRKYGPIPPNFEESSIKWYDLLPKAQFGKAVIGGKTILTASFTLNDGELGDDTAKDGTIYDIGGLFIPENDDTGDNTDKDNDGLPDAWETANNLNPFVSDASADPDGDGYSNLEEYEAETDPNDPASYPDSCSDPGTCTGFRAGVFAVGKTGIVKADYLFDGGAWEGELGIFSLEGMESLEPGSPEFIAEAVRRVMSKSEQGYVVISDKTEGARFSGQLGSSKEPNRNKGVYQGQKSFTMNPGDTFAAMLVPNSTFAALSKNPATKDTAKHPIFSLASSNPEHEMYFGQIAKITDGDSEFRNAVALEDMAIPGSDRDYNDMIVYFSGVTLSAPTLDNPELGMKEDWRKSQNPVIPHIEVSPPNPDTLWITITLKSPADLFVYDPQGRMIGKEGGEIPGATFETDADGHQIVSLPKLDSGEYRVVLRAVGEGGLCHLEVRGYRGETELTAKEVPFEIGAHETFATVISADAFLDSTVIDFGTPDVPVSASGKTLYHDFNGDGKINDADIARVSAIWNTCKGKENYDPFFDMDNDGCITVKDIMKVAGGR